MEWVFDHTLTLPAGTKIIKSNKCGRTFWTKRGIEEDKINLDKGFCGRTSNDRTINVFKKVSSRKTNLKKTKSMKLIAGDRVEIINYGHIVNGKDGKSKDIMPQYIGKKGKITQVRNGYMILFDGSPETIGWFEEGQVKQID